MADHPYASPAPDIPGRGSAIRDPRTATVDGTGSRTRDPELRLLAGWPAASGPDRCPGPAEDCEHRVSADAEPLAQLSG